MAKQRCHHKTWTQPKKGFQYCVDCHIEFPCKTDCVHVDCLEVKGVDPVCDKCNKKVKLDDAFFMPWRGVELLALCPKCVPLELKNP